MISVFELPEELQQKKFGKLCSKCRKTFSRQKHLITWIFNLEQGTASHLLQKH